MLISWSMTARRASRVAVLEALRWRQVPEALEISLLGPPQVRRAGHPVGFDTRKATALLAHLALAGRPRSRAALCELLWPDRDPEHARGALRRTLSALRKAIGEGWIETSGDSVALRDDAGLAVDVRRFRTLAARTATPEKLAEAAELFRGDLLEGFWLRDNNEFETWQAYEAELLERELADVLARLVRLLAARGEYGRAIPHVRRWLALDPLQEPAHRELIRLYALTGDRAAALAQYRDCVRTLNEELGVPPLEDTTALFEQVSDGTLTGTVPAPPVRPRAAEPAPAHRELPLVGRADELAALLDSHAAATPDGRLALVEGEAGIGKSRLVHELAATVGDRGGIVLAASCHEDEAGLPYGPMVDLLGAALRMRGDALAAAAAPQRLADASLLLPDLASLRADIPPPVGVGDPGARARLLEAVATVLAEAAGGACAGVVLVDDADAADEATLDALVYLAAPPPT
jgi:DNA-binding SARP family transcriptional activator